MRKTLINIIAILIFLGLAYFGYVHFMGSSNDAASTGVVVTSGTAAVNNTNANIDQDVTVASQQFLSLLHSLERIDFTKGTILQSRVFDTALQDFSKRLDDRAVGRDNPFSATIEGANYIIYSTSTWPTASSSKTTR